MEKNEGQRRRDTQDGYASWVVRPAIRKDPEPTYPWQVALAVVALVVIGCAFGVCVAIAQP